MDNRFDYPCAEVLNRLGDLLYRTDEHGAVEVVGDGTQVWIETERRDGALLRTEARAGAHSTGRQFLESRWLDQVIVRAGVRPGKPEQVAQLVLFLASDASSHITGTEIWINGAQSLLQA